MPNAREEGYVDSKWTAYEYANITSKDTDEPNRWDGVREMTFSRDGRVRTIYGVVDVYSWGYWREGEGWRSRHTRLSLTLEGVEHSRRWDGRYFSARYLTTLALDFSRDIAFELDIINPKDKRFHD